MAQKANVKTKIYRHPSRFIFSPFVFTSTPRRYIRYSRCSRILETPAWVGISGSRNTVARSCRIGRYHSLPYHGRSGMEWHTGLA